MHEYPGHRERDFRLRGRGKLPKNILLSRGEYSGLPDKIRQTVTKVERYHSLSHRLRPVTMNVGVYQNSWFFFYRKRERTKRK